MYIKSINELDKEFYENSIPIFNVKNISYLRKEKNGYISFYSKKCPYLREMIINQTGYQILLLCKDIKPNQICEEILKSFKNVDKDTIIKDLKEILFTYTKAGIIDWKEGRNPFMNYYSKKISDNLILSLAKEDDLIKIKNFVELNLDKDTFYLNPTRNKEEYLSEIAYKEKLFLYSEEFIILNNNDGEIQGIISFFIPTKNSLTISTVGIFYLPNSLYKNIKDIINFCFEIIKEFSISKITKIKYLSLVDNNKNNNLIKESLLDNGFKLEAYLEKEFDELDIEVISHLL